MPYSEAFKWVERVEWVIRCAWLMGVRCLLSRSVVESLIRRLLSLLECRESGLSCVVVELAGVDECRCQWLIGVRRLLSVWE